ncbi:MAG: DUF3568 family protein [Polyangiaceae bacterium]|nr:DUF3568 family protein [Polyangiaceae bacterium]
MKPHPRALALLLAALAPAALSGCLGAAAAGAAVGVGTYAYVKGDLNATVQAPLDKTWEATNDALADLGLIVKERTIDAFAGRIEASQVEGGDVRIRLEPAGPKATKVNIRVGTFGDEGRSRAILEEIQERLSPA